jgi:uncharacterized membrane protein
LWFVPAVLIVVATLTFAATFMIDVAAYFHHLQLPTWLRSGTSQSGALQVLIAIAAAIITVVGVVFSITILALTLASQQFGPRMMRNFVRDVGNQVTLGVFVATFVYSVLALGSITVFPHGNFVPHLSITVAEVLLLGDLAVLIYFINHIAASIQLPAVIAGIARDLESAVNTEFPIINEADAVDASANPRRLEPEDPAELLAIIEDRGGVVLASNSWVTRNSRSLPSWSTRSSASIIDRATSLSPEDLLPKSFPGAQRSRWKRRSPRLTSPDRTVLSCRIQSSPSIS